MVILPSLQRTEQTAQTDFYSTEIGDLVNFDLCIELAVALKNRAHLVGGNCINPAAERNQLHQFDVGIGSRKACGFRRSEYCGTWPRTDRWVLSWTTPHSKDSVIWTAAGIPQEQPCARPGKHNRLRPEPPAWMQPGSAAKHNLDHVLKKPL